MKKSKSILALFSFLLIGATLLTSSTALAASKTTTSKTKAKTAVTKTVTKTTAKITAKTTTKAVAKPVLNGQVVSATAKKVTVKSGTKTYDVNVSKAKVNRQSTATTTKAIAAKDLKKGEAVSIFGTLSKTTVAATSIIAGNISTSTSTSTKGFSFNKNHGTSTPEFGRNGNHASGTLEFGQNHEGIFGTVTAINDLSLTVTSMGRGEASSTDDVYTVTLSASTTYNKDQTAGTISDITVGSKVMISGDIDTTNKTATATRVDVMTKTPDQPGQPSSN